MHDAAGRPLKVRCHPRMMSVPLTLSFQGLYETISMHVSHKFVCYRYPVVSSRTHELSVGEMS